jgi:hypothetical protein
MKSPSTLKTTLVALGTAAACSAFVPSAAAQEIAAPEALAVPDAHLVASLEASGVQIYECKRDNGGALQWALKAPDASLYDDAGALAVHHFAGPSWRANDGSQIEGKVIRQEPSNTPNSVAQLLLSATSVGANGVLSEVRYVQRLATVGGTPPARPCANVGEEGRSPYLARYVFLR